MDGWTFRETGEPDLWTDRLVDVWTIWETGKPGNREKCSTHPSVHPVGADISPDFRGDLFIKAKQTRLS